MSNQDAAGMSSNAGKWEALYRTFSEQRPYGDTTTYEMAANLFAGLKTVEDWGCGLGWFKRHLDPAIRYKGVDGSHSPWADEVTDLTKYRSRAEGILLRHVLEHNDAWRAVLTNALASVAKQA